MHTNTTNPMDINAFCALPTHIATRKDGGGTLWYVLDQGLIEALELPYGFHHEDFLDLRDTCRDEDISQDGTPEDVFLVSEPGLYMLLLFSEAVAVQKFQNWVLNVVSPTLAEDSIYTMDEELHCRPPRGYETNRDDLWSGTLEGSGCARELAKDYLPELRQLGTTTWGLIRWEKDGLGINQDMLELGMAKKTIRRLMIDSPL